MIPLAHIAGMPVEETIASLGPALFLMFAAASATLRAGLRPACSSAPPLSDVVTPPPPPGRWPDAQDGSPARVHRAGCKQPDHSLDLAQRPRTPLPAEGRRTSHAARPLPRCGEKQAARGRRPAFATDENQLTADGAELPGPAEECSA
jgi:hypothetical protein